MVKNIQGHYYIQAPLFIGGDPDQRDLYTYTNANRNGGVSFAQDCNLSFIQLDSAKPLNYGDVRAFLTQGRLLIKRARIFTPGSPGICPAQGSRAARLILLSYRNIDGVYVSGDGFEIKFDYYNEWQNLNYIFENYKFQQDNPTADYYLLKIPGQSPAYMTVDDYNLQSAYEGETLRAFLELEIDCGAGMLNPNGPEVV